jgi:hypothetical protein
MSRTTAAATTLAAAVTVVAGLAVAVPGSATAASCSTNWGSGSKATTNIDHGTLTAVRAGRHTCYDRLVLDVDRKALGYSVTYVKAVRDQGRGAVVPLKGGAFLEIVEQAQATKRIAMPNVQGYTTFRQVGWGGSFEGYTTVGLGVRARLPFRAFTTGNHLVLDVAHRW